MEVSHYCCTDTLVGCLLLAVRKQASARDAACFNETHADHDAGRDEPMLNDVAPLDESSLQGRHNDAVPATSIGQLALAPLSVHVAPESLFLSHSPQEHDDDSCQTQQQKEYDFIHETLDEVIKIIDEEFLP